MGARENGKDKPKRAKGDKRVTVTALQRNQLCLTWHAVVAKSP